MTQTYQQNSRFFPSNFNIPFLSSQDMETYAALDLIAALKNPTPENPLFISDDQVCALTGIANIFASSIYPKLTPSNIAIPRVGSSTPIVVPKQTRVSPPANQPKKQGYPPILKESTNLTTVISTIYAQIIEIILLVIVILIQRSPQTLSTVPYPSNAIAL